MIVKMNPNKWLKKFWILLLVSPLVTSMINLGNENVQDVTPLASSDLQPTSTATSTLIPLPTLTFLYPTPHPSQTYTWTPQLLQATEVISQPPRSRMNLASIGLVVLVSLIWVLLAGWLYLLVSSNYPKR